MKRAQRTSHIEVQYCTHILLLQPQQYSVTPSHSGRLQMCTPGRGALGWLPRYAWARFCYGVLTTRLSCGFSSQSYQAYACDDVCILPVVTGSDTLQGSPSLPTSASFSEQFSPHVAYTTQHSCTSTWPSYASAEAQEPHVACVVDAQCRKPSDDAKLGPCLSK